MMVLDTFFHVHRRPSVGITLSSSRREQHGGSFSAHFPLVSSVHVIPCYYCNTSRQQMPPGLSADGTSGIPPIPHSRRGACSHSQRWLLWRNNPTRHLDKTFGFGYLVSGILSCDSCSFWQEEPGVILPSLTTEHPVRTPPDELDPR